MTTPQRFRALLSEGQRINVKRVVGWWRRPTDVEVHRLYHHLPVWFGA